LIVVKPEAPSAQTDTQWVRESGCGVVAGSRIQHADYDDLAIERRMLNDVSRINETLSKKRRVKTRE